MNKRKKKRILFLGLDGFPFGSAFTQRQVQLGKAFLETGFKVTVINKSSQHSKRISKRENILAHGFYQNIEYFYCSLLPYRSSNFIIRNIFKLIGGFIQPFIILYYRIFRNAKYIFNNSIYLKNIKYCYFLSKLFRMKLIFDYVEFMASVRNRHKKYLVDIESRAENDLFKYTDKLIVISNFLEKYVKETAPNIPMIRIPPVIDFSFIDSIPLKITSDRYFLLCASGGYQDIIKFTIEAFAGSYGPEKNYKLKLVINGNPKELEAIHLYIEEIKFQNYIEILSELPYSDLISFYKSARALLIPISNNLQDLARFPFKICEYIASKRPIITSDLGAVKEFFEDNVNAFIAKTDNVNDFSKKLNLVMEYPDLANEIGSNGYELGKNVFNYETYSKDLGAFIHK